MPSCDLVSLIISDRDAFERICERKGFLPMRIFHRIDDVRYCSREMLKVLDFFAGTVRELIVAAIPCGLSKEMGRRICDYRNCSVYQHGYKHVNRVSRGWCDEFPETFSAVKARELIKTGRCRLEDVLQREVRGYVPPWNNTSAGTVRILGELGFEIYSAQRSNTRPFLVNRDVCVDVASAYVPKIRYRSVDQVLDRVREECRSSEEIGILYHFKDTSAVSLSEMFRLVEEVEALQTECIVKELRNDISVV